MVAPLGQSSDSARLCRRQRSVGRSGELRQVTVTASRLAFAVELGTAKAREAKTIPLLYQGRKVAELFILIRLVADSADRYPAVSKSKFELRINRLPLLRLDFDRDMHTAPGCHWNVHAERGAITTLLARNNPDHSGELCKLHLPVGGARMRPCLEDLLQLLVEEFRFDANQGALEAIQGRSGQMASPATGGDGPRRPRGSRTSPAGRTRLRGEAANSRCSRRTARSAPTLVRQAALSHPSGIG